MPCRLHRVQDLVQDGRSRKRISARPARIEIPNEEGFHDYQEAMHEEVTTVHEDHDAVTYELCRVALSAYLTSLELEKTRTKKKGVSLWSQIGLILEAS